MTVRLRNILAVAGCIVLGGCSGMGNPPEAYKDASDRMVTRLGLEAIFGDPCYEPETHSGVEIAAFVGAENCYRFDKPRRFRGYWISEFEGSEFVIDNGDYVGERIWLSIDNLAFRPEFRDDYENEPHIIWLDVTGRITSASGRYGHLGGSTRLVLVDEVHSARLVSSGVEPKFRSSFNPSR